MSIFSHMQVYDLQHYVKHKEIGNKKETKVGGGGQLRSSIYNNAINTCGVYKILSTYALHRRS
jgi:hypothetical protein